MVETKPVLCGSVSGCATRLGVQMHDAGYSALGLDFKYVAIRTHRLEPTVTAIRALGFRGFALSMPFKSEILNHLDRLTPEVERIGACNTVVHEDGLLTGYNTDWSGALAALDEVVAELPSRAVVIGAGGVARAIAHGLRTRGVRVFVAARSAEQRATVVADLGLEGHGPLVSQGEFAAPLVVQATPSSDWPGSPLDPALHPAGEILLDVVSERRTTPLAAHLRQLAWTVVPGWRMRLHQALRQFRLYTGCEPPVAVMEKTLAAALEEDLDETRCAPPASSDPSKRRSGG